jgi:hypothetical protein
MESKKYVVGAGISGLIFAYYNPEFTIISPDIGGQMTHGMHSMTWVHDTEMTRKLLNDLEIPFTTTKTRIGYYYDGKVNFDCNDNSNVKIIKKKMSDWTNLNDKFEIKDKTLSVPETFINTLNTDFTLLLKKLATNKRVINDYIVGISTDKIYGQNGEYEYDTLVSTMPSKLFWNAYSKNVNFIVPELKSTPITFIVSKEKFEWYDDLFEMIYIAEDYYFTRVSYRDNEYVYEFTGVMPEDVFEKLYNFKIKRYYINKFGRIHSADNEPPQDNIYFLGRFSEWKHQSKIQDVVSKSILFNSKI